VNIGLDIMGGDFAPEATVLGAIEAQKLFSEKHTITLVGDSDAAKAILLREGVDPSLFNFVHTTQVIEMGDHATKAMRKKLDSSINIGFKLLGEGKLDAFSSAGNSGAMLIGSMFSIRPIGGVIRPCITSVLPKESGGVGVILDVGINADCKPDVLYQFAILGSLYAEFVFNIKSPKVGLLNIGEEKEKGNLLAQATHQLMEGSEDFNFVGNIEGREIFEDKADVVVCDGFTGNVILKEAEAFYTLIAKRGLLDDYFKRFNYENYGGTPVLGVNGNVLIGHGISNAKAIKNMLNLALDLAEADLPNKIKKAFK
jgi:glycerol-3-phosphate acyltransferase PlsX